MNDDELAWRIYYRDRLRNARYAALADAEAFSEICFVIEALGVQLVGREGTLELYRNEIERLANSSLVLTSMPQNYPSLFRRFSVLYKMMQGARNDAMHSGIYARHVTGAAIEMCIGLEEALMAGYIPQRKCVKDYMVQGAVQVKAWHPVAHARQLMLMHSFTFLPVLIGDKWSLVSEVAMVNFLFGSENRQKKLGMSIESAAVMEEGRLELVDAKLVVADDLVTDLLETSSVSRQQLWLVSDGHGGLSGVLSPFELM